MDVTPRAGRWGLPPTALPQPAQILLKRNCPREGDTGRTLQPQSSRTLSRMEIPAGSAAVLFVNKNGIHY